MRDGVETRVAAKMQVEQSLSFDRYRLDLSNAQLWRGKRVLPLTRQTFTVLRYCSTTPGRW